MYCILIIIIDSLSPSSPVVTDETVQSQKVTIDKQTAQITSLEQKVADLQAFVESLVYI